jgi:pantothenate kinase type III
MSARLFVSIGNTTLHWAAERRGKWSAHGRVAWRAVDDGTLATPLATTGFDRLAINREASCTAIIACVSSPARLPAFEASAPCPVRVMRRDFDEDSRSGSRSGIPVAYRRPREIGADRMASATAAVRLYGTPSVVVSAGTCLTCEAISAEGTLIGGAIAPGLPAYRAGMAQVTPHLPRDYALSAAGPLSPGQTTRENLALGISLSLAGAADRLAAAMRETVGAEARLLLTGGDAELIAHFSALDWTVVPLLTLEGLRIIYDAA